MKEIWERHLKLFRQLELLQSMNWNVVKASQSDQEKLGQLIIKGREHLNTPCLYTNAEKLAPALCDFYELVQTVSNIAETYPIGKAWLIDIGENILANFGPADSEEEPNPLRAKVKQKEFLVADIAHIQRLLADLKPEHVLERYSLESRLEDVQAELKAFEETPEAASQRVEQSYQDKINEERVAPELVRNE